MVFVDANPIIYHVEQPAIWGLKASARIIAFVAAGRPLAITDLVRMECLVGPLKKGDSKLLRRFQIINSSRQAGIVGDRSAPPAHAGGSPGRTIFLKLPE